MFFPSHFGLLHHVHKCFLCRINFRCSSWLTCTQNIFCIFCVLNWFITVFTSDNLIQSLFICYMETTKLMEIWPDAPRPQLTLSKTSPYMSSPFHFSAIFFNFFHFSKMYLLWFSELVFSHKIQALIVSSFSFLFLFTEDFVRSDAMVLF